MCHEFLILLADISKNISRHETLTETNQKTVCGRTLKLPNTLALIKIFTTEIKNVLFKNSRYCSVRILKHKLFIEETVT